MLGTKHGSTLLYDNPWFICAIYELCRKECEADLCKTWIREFATVALTHRHSRSKYSRNGCLKCIHCLNNYFQINLQGNIAIYKGYFIQKLLK